MNKKYKHLFFDLDRTLWDYNNNAREALYEIFIMYKLDTLGIVFNDYIDAFTKSNEYMWARFRNREINKQTLRSRRFYMTLEKFGIKDADIALRMDNDYIRICPTKTNLFPYVLETLEYLKQYYRLHIITNGFNEVQFLKLKNSGIEDFFEKVVTSDSIGVQKPHADIFHYSLTSVNARKSESLMIGDDLEVDIEGARKYGLDQMLFNPLRIKHNMKPTYEVFEILDLKKLL